MFNLIPAQYRVLIGVALVLIAVATIYGVGRHHGSQSVQADWDSEKAAQAIANAEAATKQAEATVKVVTEYVDRVKVVHEKAKTIIKEIPVYVPSDTCLLPGGFRVLHDAAAANTLPDPAGIANAPAADAQAVATTVAGNYATCHEIREQLIGLQAWARDAK